MLCINKATTDLYQIGGMQNKLLSSLGVNARRKIVSVSELINISPKRTIMLPDVHTSYIYFLVSGLISVVAASNDGRDNADALLIGKNGLAGIQIVLGVDCSSHRHVTRAPGKAWRVKTGDMRRLIDELPELRDVLLRYVDSVSPPKAASDSRLM